MVSRRKLLKGLTGVGSLGSVAGCLTSKQSLPRPETVWTTTVPSPRQPTIHGDAVLIHDTEGLVSLDRANGKQQWRNPIHIASGEQPRVPVADDQRIYSASSKAVYSLDRKTGETVWEHSHRSQEKADTIVLANELVCTTPALVVRDAATGEHLWTRPIAWPYLSENGFYHARPNTHNTDSTDGTEGEVRSFDTRSGNVQWTYAFNNVTSLEIVAATPENVLVAVHKPAESSKPHRFVALDTATGERNWQHRVQGSGLPRVGAVADEAATIQTDSWYAAIDLETGEERWRQPLGALLARVRGSRLIVGEESDNRESRSQRLRALTWPEGKDVWTDDWRSSVATGTFAATIGHVFAESNRERQDVLCLDIQTGEPQWRLPRSLNWSAAGKTVYGSELKQNRVSAFR